MTGRHVSRTTLSIVLGLSLTILNAAEVAAQGRFELELPEFRSAEAKRGNGRIFGARFSPDGSELWIGRNQQLFVFYTNGGKLINQIATSPSEPLSGVLISSLWFVTDGKYLLLDAAQGGGNGPIRRFGLLPLDGRSGHTQWFDPSGQGIHSIFAGELDNGELVFVCGENKRGRRQELWTVIDPSAPTLKASPLSCDIAIDLGCDYTAFGVQHLLPRDVCSGDGVRLAAVQCGSQAPSIRSTSLKPIELKRDGDKLVPEYGTPWSFSDLPLAIHWGGECVASQRQINPSNVLVHAHTSDGRKALVGELRIGLASRRNLAWYGDFFAASDFPDPPTRPHSVETSVRIASFKQGRPPIRLLTGKGVSASVAAVSIDGARMLTQTVLGEPPIEHSRWTLWTQHRVGASDQTDSRYD